MFSSTTPNTFGLVLLILLVATGSSTAGAASITTITMKSK